MSPVSLITIPKDNSAAYMDAFDVHSSMVDMYLQKVFNTHASHSSVTMRVDAVWNLVTRIAEWVKRRASGDHSLNTRSHIPSMMELFLYEMMHQTSLCIGNEDDRKAFVEEFRENRFKKQHIIATYVMGPLIRESKMSMLHNERHAMDEVVRYFGRYVSQFSTKHPGTPHIHT